MNVALWIVQILLAVAFLAAGFTKLSQPKDKLRAQMGWVDSYSDGMVKTIGGLEVLGALGLILPQATGIATVLTPLAALGFVAIMVGAVVVHLRRGEAKVVPANIALGALALFVVIGRFATM